MSKHIEIQDETELAANENEISGEPTEDAASDAPANDLAVPLQDDLSAQLAAAQKQAQENYDRLLRASAEFENYKKRTTREMQEVVKYANERMAQELLGVVDNLERAIASATQAGGADHALVQGVELTLNETIKILERHHVTPIQAVGQPFDPNFHQAMLQMDSADQPPNTVVQELQRGYRIHERLLRPALVAVSKAGDAAKPNGE
ncbi:MAG: nucleotide exchange factor GrpE [Desulfatitalea sp.]|nr:nucleotide exchange factor GrpE [Desulfatitalea sp.]